MLLFQVFALNYISGIFFQKKYCLFGGKFFRRRGISDRRFSATAKSTFKKKTFTKPPCPLGCPRSTAEEKLGCPSCFPTAVLLHLAGAAPHPVQPSKPSASAKHPCELWQRASAGAARFPQRTWNSRER